MTTDWKIEKEAALAGVRGAVIRYTRALSQWLVLETWFDLTSTSPSQLPWAVSVDPGINALAWSATELDIRRGEGGGGAYNHPRTFHWGRVKFRSARVHQPSVYWKAQQMGEFLPGYLYGRLNPDLKPELLVIEGLKDIGNGQKFRIYDRSPDGPIKLSLVIGAFLQTADLLVQDWRVPILETSRNEWAGSRQGDASVRANAGAVTGRKFKKEDQDMADAIALGQVIAARWPTLPSWVRVVSSPPEKEAAG